MTTILGDLSRRRIRAAAILSAFAAALAAANGCGDAARVDSDAARAETSPARPSTTPAGKYAFSAPPIVVLRRDQAGVDRGDAFFEVYFRLNRRLPRARKGDYFDDEGELPAPVFARVSIVGAGGSGPLALIAYKPSRSCYFQEISNSDSGPLRDPSLGDMVSVRLRVRGLKKPLRARVALSAEMPPPRDANGVSQGQQRPYAEQLGCA